MLEVWNKAVLLSLPPRAGPHTVSRVNHPPEIAPPIPVVAGIVFFSGSLYLFGLNKRALARRHHPNRRPLLSRRLGLADHFSATLDASRWEFCHAAKSSSRAAFQTARDLTPAN